MSEATTQEVIEEAAKEGALVVRDLLKQRSASDEELALARIGATAMSNYAKIYQANAGREATMVTIIGRAAESGEEFRRLVGASLPASPVTKALSERSGAEHGVAGQGRAKLRKA